MREGGKEEGGEGGEGRRREVREGGKEEWNVLTVFH